MKLSSSGVLQNSKGKFSQVSALRCGTGLGKNLRGNCRLPTKVEMSSLQWEGSSLLLRTTWRTTGSFYPSFSHRKPRRGSSSPALSLTDDRFGSFEVSRAKLFRLLSFIGFLLGHCKRLSKKVLLFCILCLRTGTS